MRRLFDTDQRLAEVLALSALIFVLLLLFGLCRPAHAADAGRPVVCEAVQPHLIEAEVPRARYLELGLKVGQAVMIAARAARVFPA